MVLHAAGLDARAGQTLGDIDKNSSLVCADLIDEDWGCVGEDDVAVVGHGEFCIDHLQTPELTADLRLVRDIVFSELGSVAVSYKSHSTKIAVFLAIALAFNAQDLACVITLHNICDGGLDNCDVGRSLGGSAQFRDEAAVVEGPTLRLLRRLVGDEIIRVSNVNRLSVV